MLTIPTTGMIDDFTLDCVFYEESTNVAYNVSSSGSLTARTDVRTIKEQWEFLFEEILESNLENNIFAEYELYIEWNDQTYIGWLEIESPISNDDYSGRVEYTLIFKKGKNPLSSLSS